MAATSFDGECFTDATAQLDNRHSLAIIIGDLVKLATHIVLNYFCVKSLELADSCSVFYLETGLVFFIRHHNFAIYLQMFLLTINSQYAQHLVGNTLVAISEFLLALVQFCSNRIIHAFSHVFCL